MKRSDVILLNWSTPIVLVSAAPAFAAQYFTVTQVQKLMFPDGQAFLDLSITLSKDQKAAIEKGSDTRVRDLAPKIWRVKGSKGPLGFFVVDEVLGKHAYITYALALDPQKVLRSVEILQYSETYGFEVRNEKWRGQFVGKKVTDPIELDKDIANISGATLSCRHVTDGVRRILRTFEVIDLSEKH